MHQNSRHNNITHQIEAHELSFHCELKNKLDLQIQNLRTAIYENFTELRVDHIFKKIAHRSLPFEVSMSYHTSK